MGGGEGGKKKKGGFSIEGELNREPTADGKRLYSVLTNFLLFFMMDHQLGKKRGKKKRKEKNVYVEKRTPQASFLCKDIRLYTNHNT